MTTNFKKIADDMRHDAFGMITDDQYEKCKEVISKYMDLISRITYVSTAMPISETTLVGGMRCDLVMELGEILCRKLELAEAKKILSEATIFVDGNDVWKRVPLPIWVLTDEGKDVTEAVAWTTVVSILNRKHSGAENQSQAEVRCKESCAGICGQDHGRNFFRCHA